MARPRTPAAETPPTAPPLVTKDSLPADEMFSDYRKTTVTRIAGPFEPPLEIETSEGPIVVDEPVFIGVDSKGHPYPIAPEVLEATYAPAGAEPSDGPGFAEPSTAAEELDAIRKTAFEEGVAEGLRRATVKELPLFERAKQLAREHALNGSTEPQLRDAISALEAERDTQLSRSDHDLVLAGYRRFRAHQVQRDEAAREPGRPRRPVPRERQPKQTEYEHIR